MSYDEGYDLRPTRAERAWLKRLRALVKSQPPGTWVLLEQDRILYLLRYGDDGLEVMTPGGAVDQSRIVGRVSNTNWDSACF